MKKVLVTLVLALAFVIPFYHSCNANDNLSTWYWLASNDYNTVYVDKKTGYRSGNSVYVWEKWTNVDGSYYLLHNKYTVKNRSIYRTILSSIDYDSEGNLTDSYDFSEYESTKILAPDTIGEIVGFKVITMFKNAY